MSKKEITKKVADSDDANYDKMLQHYKGVAVSVNEKIKEGHKMEAIIQFITFTNSTVVVNVSGKPQIIYSTLISVMDNDPHFYNLVKEALKRYETMEVNNL